VVQFVVHSALGGFTQCKKYIISLNVWGGFWPLFDLSSKAFIRFWVNFPPFLVSMAIFPFSYAYILKYALVYGFYTCSQIPLGASIKSAKLRQQSKIETIWHTRDSFFVWLSMLNGLPLGHII